MLHMDAHLDIGRVDPQVGPLSLDRLAEKLFRADIDILAQSGHLAFRNAGHAHGFDEIVDQGSVPPKCRRMVLASAAAEDGRWTRRNFKR
jgi:hypothetical protein